MENRDRDKVSRNTSSTEAGDLNRETSSRIGNERDDSDAEFGQNIGRSENLDEPNRRSGTVDDSGMEGSDDEKESWRDESSSNIGDEVSDRNSGRTLDRSQIEH